MVADARWCKYMQVLYWVSHELLWIDHDLVHLRRMPMFCQLRPVLPFSGVRLSASKVPLQFKILGIRARPVRDVVHRANYQNSFTRQCSYHLPEHALWHWYDIWLYVILGSQILFHVQGRNFSSSRIPIPQCHLTKSLWDLWVCQTLNSLNWPIHVHPCNKST